MIWEWSLAHYIKKIGEAKQEAELLLSMLELLLSMKPRRRFQTHHVGVVNKDIYLWSISSDKPL